MPTTKNPTTKPTTTKHAVPKKGAKKVTAPKRVSKAKDVVAAPVVEPVLADVPAIVPTIVPAAAPAAPVAAVSDEKSGTTLVAEEFTAYLAKLQQAVSLLSTLRTEFRVLERKALRELRNAEKINSKRKRKAGTRAPSGFVKPTLISDELANFLLKPHGSEMARTEVTREINAYIRAHNLQDKQNGRKINADKKLSTLLSLTAHDELTYFNLQKYMSRHFAKASKPLISSVTASSI